MRRRRHRPDPVGGTAQGGATARRRGRFEPNRERSPALYDERFCRMSEMYLVGAEISFRRGGSLVFQMQMAKAIETVPLTRDYMQDWERAHTALPESSADRAA